MALESFMTKYNPGYMKDKRWEDEATREDTPTINVVIAELGRTAVTKWVMIQIAALNNLGNHFKMDEFQVQHTAEMIVARYTRMTVAQLIAFFQWYVSEGDEKQSIDAINIIRSFPRYQDAIRGEAVKRDNSRSGEVPVWMKGPYTMTVEQVKAMDDYELERRFHALPQGEGGVCLESGDAYMITGEYLKRARGAFRFFENWENEVRAHLQKKQAQA